MIQILCDRFLSHCGREPDLLGLQPNPGVQEEARSREATMGVNPRNIHYVPPPSLKAQGLVVAAMFAAGYLGYYFEVQVSIFNQVNDFNFI